MGRVMWFTRHKDCTRTGLRRVSLPTARRAFLLALAALGGAFAPARALADDLEPVRLVYRAPDGCPSAADFLDQVRRAVPRLRVSDPRSVREDDPSARLFVVAIEASGKRGRLSIRRGDVATGAR
jgi:hypothetical protein